VLGWRGDWKARIQREKVGKEKMRVERQRQQ
jgi:hypothetical protein